jgi:TetR/AcrR family transcriptional regulator, cholesterol catabolism regulator
MAVKMEFGEMDVSLRTKARLRPQDLTPMALCEELFQNHGDTIRIKKAHIAVPNLEKILLAALEIGSRKGFHSTTTRDLAEASGLSMGAIYTYVDNKESLLRMILEAVSFAVEHAIAPDEDGEENNPSLRLRGLIRRHIMVTEIMQRWFYFAFLEVKAFDKAARELALASELRTERLLADAIQSGIDTGVYAPADPLVMAGLIKPMLQDWYVKRWKFRQRGISKEQYIDIVTGFVERAIAR